MSFLVRTHRRYPICCGVACKIGALQGAGTISNLSVSGLRFSTNLFLVAGQVCSLTLDLPNWEKVRVTAGIVRWMRERKSTRPRAPCTFEYGVEVLVADTQGKRQLVEYLKGQVS